MSSPNRIPRRDFLGASGFLGAGMLAGGGFLAFWQERMDAEEIAAAEAGKIAFPVFVAAKPVWAAGRQMEMNVSLRFVAEVTLPDGENFGGYLLRMTGSTIARIYVNGRFTGYGPARGPHGWFRIDEWKVGPFLQAGSNRIEIEVAGYNSNSYYLLDQPSFLQAELVDGANTPLASTGVANDSGDKFEAFDFTGVRVQKVQRFSFQRPFIEVYDHRKKPSESAVELAEQPAVNYLPRRVPYPEFALIEPVAWLKRGTVQPREVFENPWRDRSLVNIGPKLKGYTLDELELVLSDEVQRQETTFTDGKPLARKAEYREGDVQIVDFGANYTGFFGVELEKTTADSVLVITFDEILSGEGDVDFLRLGTCSAVKWTLSQGDNTLEMFEPQVGRYAKIHCLAGGFTLKRFYLREYAYPAIRVARFESSDPALDEVYRAAVLTFRENSLDAFTDCPHRERAGWLCDSFFTARTAFDLTGKTDVEQVFFENYQLPEKFAFLPDGMLPMCYPADHYDGIYIPNWSLWFVAQLAEYARRSPDRSTVAGLRQKIEKLFAFFAKLENSDGLLEKLPSWVFVEWSAANEFVQDVNYPSNMLYAAALDYAGTIYDVAVWRDKAKRIRETIIAQSFDGTFFVDNAIRHEDGSLEVTRNRSEICQYFAFFFETATPESHPDLWRILLDEFGPNRVSEGGWPEIHKANSFVGNVVRLELLSRSGRCEQLLEESIAYNLYMAERTGTLWENDGAYASCNHGFASHVAHVLYRDILGIHEVDPIQKTVKIILPKIEYLQFADGVKPVPGGEIRLRWEKADGEIRCRLLVPDGYTVALENRSDLEVVAE